jgi:hypothetical protein
LCIPDYRLSEILGNIIMSLERFVPGLLVILFHHRDGDNREDNLKSKLHKTASSIVFESLDVPPHTRILPDAVTLQMPN